MSKTVPKMSNGSRIGYRKGGAILCHKGKSSAIRCTDAQHEQQYSVTRSFAGDGNPFGEVGIEHPRRVAGQYFAGTPLELLRASFAGIGAKPCRSREIASFARLVFRGVVLTRCAGKRYEVRAKRGPT